MCTITCKKIDKGSGVGDVNGARVVADTASHTYTNNSYTVSTNTASTFQSGAITRHVQTGSIEIHMHNTVRILCNLTQLYGQTYQNFYKGLRSSSFTCSNCECGRILGVPQILITFVYKKKLPTLVPSSLFSGSS